MTNSDGLAQRPIRHAAIVRCVVGAPRPLHRERSRHVARAALLALLVAGCSESTGPSTGAVHADLTTTEGINPNAVTGTLAVTVVRNVDFDPNGFSLSVDGSVPTFVPGVFPGHLQQVTLPGLSAGAHNLALSGVAGNCTVNVVSPTAFTIFPSATAQVRITIVCAMHEVTG